MDVELKEAIAAATKKAQEKRARFMTVMAWNTYGDSDEGLAKYRAAYATALAECLEAEEAQRRLQFSGCSINGEGLSIGAAGVDYARNYLKRSGR